MLDEETEIESIETDLAQDEILDTDIPAEYISYSIDEEPCEDVEYVDEHDADSSSCLDEVIEEGTHEIAAPRLIFDPEEYTSDPLQMGIDDLDLLKFDDDIPTPAKTIATKESDAAPTTEGPSIEKSDVSLFLKFGYGESVGTQLGTEKVRKIIFEKDRDFFPEPHNVSFGFTGKEFTSKDQIDEIRQKYKSDRFAALVILIVVSAFTLLSFTLGLFFEFSAERLDYYLPIMSFDFLLVAISALICRKRIWAGAVAISRFEANAHSILVISSAEYAVYNVVSSAIYLTDSALMQTSFCWISGSVVLAYFTVIALCDLINCHKEYKTFELMTQGESFYTAEKLYQPQSEDSLRSDGYSNIVPGAYKVKKTSMVGGYFKKTCSSSVESTSPIYMLGIVPIISLVLACGTAIISENAAYGIHTFIMVSLLCMPLPCLGLGAVSEFLNSQHHQKHNAAFIGRESKDEYAVTSMLVFDDTEAVEVVSFKEINHGKSTDDAHEKLTLAYNILKTLHGPLGEALVNKCISNDGHELIINSISDNGINVYFDSSTNVLIGNKQYMLSHNLKVKTDINLTTATKGPDRAVIYMAFDGKPQVGFVLTGRIKPDFSQTTSILNACRVAISVESYEPWVNDMFFERNKTAEHYILGVHKPSKYQAKANDETICGGTLIAKDTLSLSRAISECKKEPMRKKSIKHANLISILMGITASAAIALIMCIDTPIKALDFMRTHPVFLLYTAVILCAIPAIINSVKEYLSYKDSAK